MNILKDLGKIINDDYQLEVTIDTDGVTVNLGYYEYDEEENKSSIPIRIVIPDFEELSEGHWVGRVYIPQNDFIENYTDEFGMDTEDIDMISKIMHYLQDNSREIEEICRLFKGGKSQSDLD